MTYRLIFRNTMTKEVFVFQFKDRSDSPNFYRFPLPLGMTEGEYEYYIVQSGGTLNLYPNDVRKSDIDGQPLQIYDNGVAQVGKIGRQEQSYNINRTYEQYKG